MNEVKTSIVGVRYNLRSWERYIQTTRAGTSEIRLQSEPENRFDPNAIAVYLKGESFGKLGYIPRTENGLIGEIIKNDYEVICEEDIAYDSLDSIS